MTRNWRSVRQEAEDKGLIGPHEPFVDLATVAEFLGKPKSWLYNNQARYDIPRYRFGNRYRYRLSEIEEWAKRFER